MKSLVKISLIILISYSFEVNILITNINNIICDEKRGITTFGIEANSSEYLKFSYLKRSKIYIFWFINSIKLKGYMNLLFFN